MATKAGSVLVTGATGRVGRSTLAAVTQLAKSASSTAGGNPLRDPQAPPWINERMNLRALKRRIPPLKDAQAVKGAPCHATHGGLPPSQADHYMTPVAKKYGANYFPFNPDYHWVPYYGGDAAPKWENPKDNPRVGWADHVTSEVDNALTNCAIDLPVFGILDVQGPKAFEFLNKISTKKCSKKVGDLRLGYTLTKDGMLWNDVSLATRGENDVYFIGLGGFGKYELDQLESMRTELEYTSDDVTFTNRSYDQQIMHIFGPKAPQILSEILGPEILDVPFFKFRKMTVKGIPLEAYRMSYAALPGWELHTSKEFAPQLYDMLLSHPLSKAEGFKPCGVMGIQSLRTEMWFRGTPDVKAATHYKGGSIERAIGKNHTFYGQNDAYEPKEKVVMLTVEAPQDYEWSLFGAQYPVYYNGAKVGHTLHSAFGGRSKKTHAFALIDVNAQGDGKMFSIVAHDKEMPAFQSAEPMVQSTFRETNTALWSAPAKKLAPEPQAEPVVQASAQPVGAPDLDRPSWMNNVRSPALRSWAEATAQPVGAPDLDRPSWMNNVRSTANA